MKFIFSIFATCIVSMVSSLSIELNLADTDLPADSEIGMKLISKARKVEQNDDGGMTWLSGYSIKFLGCHHIQQWNSEAEDKEDVRIKLKRLVRFRLCPSHECTSHNAGGCLDGYGDYIIDLSLFMKAYFELTRQASQYECKQYYNTNCDCDENEGDDQYDVDACKYECYAVAGLEESCVDRDDDAVTTGVEAFYAEQYMECAKYQFNQDDDAANQRKLEDEEDEGALYIGPFCKHQGGQVLLGGFTDDTCSEFADDKNGRETFKELSGGMRLPYSLVSLSPKNCVACLDQDVEYDDASAYWNTTSMEACQQMYSTSGKCEKRLDDIVDTPNKNACTYIKGIKLVRQNGNGIVTRHSGPRGTMNWFIVLFAFAFVNLGYYTQYVRKILKHKAMAQALLPSGSFA